MTKFLIYIFICYGISAIVVKGDIFRPIRDYFMVKVKFIYSILSCMQCFPFWLGVTFSILLNVIGSHSISYEVVKTNIFLNIFLDGCLTSGFVYFLNNISE